MNIVTDEGSDANADGEEAAEDYAAALLGGAKDTSEMSPARGASIGPMLSSDDETFGSDGEDDEVAEWECISADSEEVVSEEELSADEATTWFNTTSSVLDALTQSTSDSTGIDVVEELEVTAACAANGVSAGCTPVAVVREEEVPGHEDTHDAVNRNGACDTRVPATSFHRIRPPGVRMQRRPPCTVRQGHNLDTTLKLAQAALPVWALPGRWAPHPFVQQLPLQVPVCVTVEGSQQVLLEIIQGTIATTPDFTIGLSISKGLCAPPRAYYCGGPDPESPRT